MNTIMKNKLMTVLLIASFQSWVLAGNIEVGTQFTYQGELIDNGSPANGAYDFVFQLYGSSAGGTVIDFVSVEDLMVSNGLINVELDYGDMPFDGDEKYLQINVRPGDSTGNLEPLIPRQRINVTPYAIQSEFTENGGSQWILVNQSLYYSESVTIGRPDFSSALLSLNAEPNQSPLIARINGGPVLFVTPNRGTQMGGVNVAAPANGLSVDGDATQQISSHGFVKAATYIQCGSGINGGSESFFNNVNGNDFTSTQNGAAGGCTITVPFDISNAFFTVSAHALGGVNVFETVVASCSAISTTQIQCQLHSISGDTTALSNGVVQLVVY